MSNSDGCPLMFCKKAKHELIGEESRQKESDKIHPEGAYTRKELREWMNNLGRK
jgi:hypothetical protein